MGEAKTQARFEVNQKTTDADLVGAANRRLHECVGYVTATKRRRVCQHCTATTVTRSSRFVKNFFQLFSLCQFADARFMTECAGAAVPSSSEHAAQEPHIIFKMRRIIDTIGGLWELLLLAWKTRFRMRSEYWKWRYETAFGTDPSKMPPRRERIRAMLDYGRWVYRIKRGR
jgi:hypothetical protein